MQYNYFCFSVPIFILLCAQQLTDKSVIKNKSTNIFSIILVPLIHFEL